MIMDISTTFLPAANNINPRLVPHKRLFAYSKNPSYHHTRRSKNGLVVIKAKKGGDDEESDQYEGKSIVGGEKYRMMVLKMRIKKMKVLEISNNMNNDGGAADPSSSDWKEWEKKLFTNYHQGVCDSIELLQSYLMNTRPSVALGALMLVAMSVPFSTSVVMVNALKVAKGLLAGCHVCIDIDF